MEGERGTGEGGGRERKGEEEGEGGRREGRRRRDKGPQAVTLTMFLTKETFLLCPAPATVGARVNLVHKLLVIVRCCPTSAGVRSSSSAMFLRFEESREL